MRWMLLLYGLAGALRADVRLPALFSDHMLLQRGAPARVWGTADPGERVTVEWNGAQTVGTTAGPAGRWSVNLPPMQAGGPFELTVRGRNTVTFKDVLVGDVWIASGQSNMAFTVARSDNAAAEIAGANHPRIRLFQVARKVADYPLDEVGGTWQVCGPETVREFSAVGYFFARDLAPRLNVPVGIIHASWGGTPAESWTSPRALAADPALISVFADWAELLEAYPRAKADFDHKRTGAAPPGPGHHWTPSGLWNGMIAPLTPYAIRGAIWYQGENNAYKGRSYVYRRLFRTMIEDWRRAWGQGDFPFLFVQLANYAKTNPGSQWPELREAQTMALALRNTGMATTIDIGNPEDIHPTNKQDVGRRLALAARAVAYGEKVEWSGPFFRQATPQANELRLWFDHAKTLVAKNGELRGFTIAGADGKFVPARARIDGITVVVSSPDVPAPVNARYGWADSPDCNLYNGEGLPASPFRTDEWTAPLAYR